MTLLTVIQKVVAVKNLKWRWIMTRYTFRAMLSSVSQYSNKAAWCC
jgi:hypothetical protein